jgi:hypothetical protein
MYLNLNEMPNTRIRSNGDWISPTTPCLFAFPSCNLKDYQLRCVFFIVCISCGCKLFFKKSGAIDILQQRTTLVMVKARRTKLLLPRNL